MMQYSYQFSETVHDANQESNLMILIQSSQCKCSCKCTPEFVRQAQTIESFKSRLTTDDFENSFWFNLRNRSFILTRLWLDSCPVLITVINEYYYYMLCAAIKKNFLLQFTSYMKSISQSRECSFSGSKFWQESSHFPCLWPFSATAKWTKGRRPDLQ